MEKSPQKERLVFIKDKEGKFSFMGVSDETSTDAYDYNGRFHREMCKECKVCFVELSKSSIEMFKAIIQLVDVPLPHKFQLAIEKIVNDLLLKK